MSCLNCKRLEARVDQLERKLQVFEDRWRNKATCEQCGREFWPRRGNAGRFCRRSCYVAYSIKIRTCEWCNKNFSKDRINRRNPRFCSYECYNKWRSSERWRKHARDCKQCGTRFLPRPSGYKTQTFCSDVCYNVYRKLHRKPREMRRCVYCGDAFEAPARKGKRGSYCTAACYNAWRQARAAV